MNKCSNCPNQSSDECVGKNMFIVDYSLYELESQIIDTLKELYKNDKYLIEIKANEVCLASLFWHYFKNKYQDKYIDYNIDMEYNRNGDDPKYYFVSTGRNPAYAKPDMIIHKRKCNRNNYLIIEFKGVWNCDNSQHENDNQKLKAFTSSNNGFMHKGKTYSYNYKLGVHVILCESEIKLKWYENGQPLVDHQITISM